jgi:hypothetical protein
MKVEVFRTNVSERWQAETITGRLMEHFPDHNVHFDLDDWEKILRVEASDIDNARIKAILSDSGFTCEILED